MRAWHRPLPLTIDQVRHRVRAADTKQAAASRRDPQSAGGACSAIGHQPRRRRRHARHLYAPGWSGGCRAGDAIGAARPRFAVAWAGCMAVRGPCNLAERWRTNWTAGSEGAAIVCTCSEDVGVCERCRWRYEKEGACCSSRAVYCTAVPRLPRRAARVMRCTVCSVTT